MGGGSADEAEVVGALKTWVGEGALAPSERQEPPTAVRGLSATIVWLVFIVLRCHVCLCVVWVRYSVRVAIAHKHVECARYFICV